jgi:hypothetical protein
LTGFIVAVEKRPSIDHRAGNGVDVTRNLGGPSARLHCRRLTRAAAGELLGITQPKVSALLNGRLDGCSSRSRSLIARPFGLAFGHGGLCRVHWYKKSGRRLRPR